MTDQFSPEERAALSPYFTNLDGPVFALVNLPEVVKGALFARYSRSPKSLRRLFLDEFLTDDGRTANQGGVAPPPTFTDTKRAEELYGRMFLEYGDDVDRRDLRHRAGVRKSHVAHARPSAPGGALVCRRDAGRAAQGESGLSPARRPPRPRRRLVVVPG